MFLNVYHNKRFNYNLPIVYRYPSSNVHLLQVCFVKYFSSHRVFDLSFLDETDFPTHLHQPIPSVDPSVRQDNGIILDIALGVMSIWHVTRKLVELCRTDWTNTGGGGTSVRTRRGVCRVTRRCLQGGQTSRQGNMEKWSGW